MAFGLGAGTALGLVRPEFRVAIGALLSALLGFVASAVTGELALSWEYLLVDIPLVAVCAAVGFTVTRAWRVRALAHPDGGGG